MKSKNIESKPRYMDKCSTQTLREGLAEYYALNSHVTQPETQPSDFAKILRAHDVEHVIYGLDTGMHDELKLLPLAWWTSECTFRRYLTMKDSPVVDVMYADLIREKGAFWLYRTVLGVLPGVLLEVIPIWFKTRHREKLLPFFNFEPLLETSLLDIRRDYGLLRFVK
ncbi:MAG: hypothetical protein AAFR99_15835 [Cyanobacteria bacterium J06629_9]